MSGSRGGVLVPEELGTGKLRALGGPILLISSLFILLAFVTISLEVSILVAVVAYLIFLEVFVLILSLDQVKIHRDRFRYNMKNQWQ